MGVLHAAIKKRLLLMVILSVVLFVPGWVLSQTCTIYTTSDFCSGWEYLGTEPGSVECVDEDTLLVSRDNHCLFELAEPLTGIVEFTADVLPAGDSNTNFSIRLGSTTSSMDAVWLGMNESNNWAYHDENGVEHWFAFSGTWSTVRILMDTEANTWSLWMDGVLIAEDIVADFDITNGINLFQLNSGRGGAAHDSYLKNIELDDCLTPTPVINARIDVQPGDDVGCLKMNGKGVIPVGIMGADDLDVYQIDPESLVFNGLTLSTVGRGRLQYAYEDLDGDGVLDMICQFEDDLSKWTPSGDQGILTGALTDGTLIEGSDEICILD